ncbi:sulfotransferase [Sphingomonas oligophenolica]|uniref:Sulfotransferase n=1 Tax=Sphingomonas oligophenolica TaxID=301154 RepID=A0ABU9YBJ1_9SPHN
MSVETVRVADMKDPVLTAVQQKLVEYTAANPVTLSAEAAIDAAKAQTGLDYFGDMGFMPRLDLIMSAADADKNLAPAGRAGFFGLAVRFLRARLELEDFIRKHPEAENVHLDPPIIDAGLPRSGTTYILQLLAADSRMRSLQHWEGLRPVADRYIKDGRDTRFELAEVEWVEMDAISPIAKLTHEFMPDHITEDIELTGMDFGGYYFEWFANIPAWRDYQYMHDPAPSLGYLRRAIKALVFQQGPGRWVGKCPQHMEQLTAVAKAFPGAFIVINHRDPVASIQSGITMLGYSARFTQNRLDLDQIATYWIERYEHLLRRCVEDREALDPGRTYDLYFHRLMADPLGEIEAIYHKAGLAFDDVARASIQKAVDANRRGKHGQLAYDLKGDFGVDPAQLRKRFDFYFNRFPEVRPEVN